MKITLRQIILPSVLSLLFLSSGSLTAQSCRDSRAVRLVEKMRQELETNEVSCAVAARGDLDRDGRADAVLQLGFEGAGGGNNYGEVLYVLPADRRKAAIAEPDESRGTIESVEVVRGEIWVKTLGHREDDPRCCPTLKGEIRLRLVGVRLVRVRGS